MISKKFVQAWPLIAASLLACWCASADLAVVSAFDVAGPELRCHAPRASSDFPAFAQTEFFDWATYLPSIFEDPLAADL